MTGRWPSSTKADREQADGTAGDGSRHRRPPGARGHRFLRRRRDVSGAPSGAAGVTCPDCGVSIQDPAEARLGFCAGCGGFTGMCGAGRKVICPDIMTVTSWHTPCTNLGTVAWEITDDQGRRVVRLCGGHDAEVRTGDTPWIAEAVPLADRASP